MPINKGRLVRGNIKFDDIALRLGSAICLFSFWFLHEDQRFTAAFGSQRLLSSILNERSGSESELTY